MRVYFVYRHYHSSSHWEEDRPFSTFKNALSYIECKTNGITHIYEGDLCHYKEYSTCVDWAHALTDDNNLENKKYEGHSPYSYMVKEVEVF